MTDPREHGFSMIELLVAMTLLMFVSSIATTALLQMTNSQLTIWNRTEMHSGIRGATELLQQEVGQAGRVSLPGTVTLAQAINPLGGAAPAAKAACDPGSPTTGADAVNVATTDLSANATAGMWANAGPPASYILLTTLDGDSQEVFKVGAINSTTSFSACFLKPHAAGTVIMPLGAFATGIIPDTGMLNPSTGTVLKLYGDVNSDGRMVYIEYTCDYVANNLYRNVMSYDAMGKPMVSDSMILLSNVLPNDPDPLTGVVRPCFKYQTASIIVQGTPFTFVLDVAITLTVQTAQIDPVTKQFQKESKSLLNVSPRNVYNAWQLAGVGYTDRVQSTPTSVSLLLP